MKAPNSQVAGHRFEAASRQDMESALAALARLVDDDPKAHGRVTILSERLRRETFHLAVLGQFKRGKSTLINALLGASLLPVAVVPLTAVPIFVSWAQRPHVRVKFHGRSAEEYAVNDANGIRDFLFSFVTEEANPNNRLGVNRVDLSYPAPLLSHGIVLIDTPGVGSTYRHNTETAFEIVSECDAALFVVSVDPPITEVELGFLKDIKSKTAKLLYVLNKIDYLEPNQRTQVAEFMRRTLGENNLWDNTSTLFSLSAQKGLEAKESGDRGGVVLSGLSSIEEYLGGVLSAEKGQLLHAAIEGKAHRILTEYVATINLRIRALELPLEDLLVRSAAFEKTLTSIEEQRQVTRDILDGDRRRLRQELEQRIERLRTMARPRLEAVAERLADPGQERDQATDAILDIFETARRDFMNVFAARFEDALRKHQRHISELIDKIRQSAGTIFDVPFPAWSEFEGFEFGADPYWVTEKMQTSLMPASSSFFDRLLPAALGRRKRTLRILANLEELTLRNAENLRWAVLRGIDESFRRAEGYFEAQIGEAIAITKNIIHEAVARKQSASSVADRELQELRTKVALLGALEGCFRSGSIAPKPVYPDRRSSEAR